MELCFGIDSQQETYYEFIKNSLQNHWRTQNFCLAIVFSLELNGTWKLCSIFGCIMTASVHKEKNVCGSSQNKNSLCKKRHVRKSEKKQTINFSILMDLEVLRRGTEWKVAIIEITDEIFNENIKNRLLLCRAKYPKSARRGQSTSAVDDRHDTGVKKIHMTLIGNPFFVI